MGACFSGWFFLMYFMFCNSDFSSATASDYDTRLVPHPATNFSYVEIYWNGSWHGVHPLLFKRKEASVVCREHGFDYVCRMKTAPPINGSQLSEQSPSCTGKEESLSYCQWKWKSLEESRSVDFAKRVLVKCTDASDFHLRLTGGSIPSEGFVMVKCDASEDWSLLCATYHWDIRDCLTICRQLDYKTCTRFSRERETVWDQSDVIWENINCGFVESHLLDCENEIYDICSLEKDGVAWMSCGVEVTVMGTETILCGPEHSCRNRCGSMWRNGTGCHCDAVCNLFEDCCVDFEEFCNGNENVHTSSMDPIQFSDPNFLMSSKCVDTSGTSFQETGYVLVAKCPSNYPQLGSVNQCEHNPVDSDVLARTPVRDSLGIAYKNVYCAICHGRKVEELSPWNVVQIVINNHRDISEDLSGEILDVPSQETYYIAKPRYAELVRPCRANGRRHCSVKLGSDINMTILAESTKKCGAYYAPVRMNVLRTWMTYQNPDCFVCTGFYNMIDIPPRGNGYCQGYTNCHCHPEGLVGCRCHKTLFQPEDEVLVEFDLSKLTQFGPAGTKQRCLGEGVVYDPFLDKCRVLECPEYYTHLGSTCVPSSLPPNGSITARIVGEKFNEGFVEILHFGKWYAALKNLFDEYARMVLCRELGLDYEPTYFFPARNRSVFTGYAIHINCTGSEPMLNYCITSFSSGMASNASSEEVFVSCVDKSETKIRLVGGRIPSEGFVQISFGKDDTRFQNSEQWYYLYGDTDHWDYRDGSVVCRELELGPCASTDRRKVSSVNATLYAITRDMFCDKLREAKLSDCLSQAVFVDEINKLAWVTCSIEAVFNDTSFHLCGSVHTCLNRCGYWDGYCNCDSSCEAFGDCCFDYKELCEAGATNSEMIPLPFPTKLSTEKYSCLIHTYGLPEIYAVVSCPDFWAPDLISDLCKRGIDDERIEHEFFLWVPVFDLDGVVYLNRFCAICNGISVESMTSFPIIMNGDKYQIDIPRTGLGVPRSCFTYTESDCNDNNWIGGANKSEDDMGHVSQKACSKVYSPIVLRDKHIFHYRNKFCAECKSLQSLSDPIQYCTLDRCPAEPSRVTEACFISENSRTVSLLFSIHTPDDVKCERPGETFNPIKGTCTFTGCPADFFHHSGVCVEGEPPFNSPQIVLAKTIHEARSCIETVIVENTSFTQDTRVCSILTNTLHGPFVVTITARDVWGFMYAHTKLLHNISTSKNGSFYHQCAAGVLHLSIMLNEFTDQPPCSHEINAQNPRTGPCLAADELGIVSFKFNTEKRAYDTVIHVSSACFEKLMEPVECRPLLAEIGDQKEKEYILPDYLFGGMTSPSMSNASDEYVVCSSRRSKDHVSTAVSMVTKCCLASSAVGITLSISTYIKFSQHLGVADGYRMQQLSSLMVIYAFQFFNTDSILESTFCKYLAVGSHFAFLSHIAWTLLIFHKMYSKYKYQLTQSLITFRETERKVHNSFATWGISLIAVFTCFFLDQCNCTPGLIVRYSSNGYRCWVMGDIAILVTVCSPVGILILFSLIGLISSFCIMRNMRKIQPSLQSEEAIKELNREFEENVWNFVGLVAVAVPGLTAFILSSSSPSSSSSSSTILTFVFLVTSALYGALLSVVFLTKRDAKNLWLDCLCRTRHTKASAPKTVGEIKVKPTVPEVQNDEKSHN